MTSGTKDNERIKTLNVPPAGRVYRRPMRKKARSENIFGIGEGVASRYSEWKNDTKIVAIVNKVSAGFDLKDGDFASFVFMGANLSKAKMAYCNFKEADLSFVNMREGDFNHSDFTNANLQNADLSKADLSYADFTGANLIGTNFSGADLTGAKIDLVLFSEDTDFGGTVGGEEVHKFIDKIEILQKAAENGLVDLRTLGIVDLRKLDLRSINLRGVYLKDKDLKGRLTGVNLSGAEINESDILGADVNMLHFQMRDINEYNEAMDLKAEVRKSRIEAEEEKADFDEQTAKATAEKAVYEEEHRKSLEEAEDLSNQRYLESVAECNSGAEAEIIQKNNEIDKNNSQNDEKNCKIVKKASVKVKPAKGKLIE